MLYLTSKELHELGIDWEQNIEIIKSALTIKMYGETCQPVKPYLLFEGTSNRIIAMPAYVGGSVAMAGIKWIASFPLNKELGIQRAHSLTILNNVVTGCPLAIFNTALISGIRTAAVSGLMINAFQKNRACKNLIVGIVGFGPIGQLHVEMLSVLYSEQIDQIIIFDIAGVQLELISLKFRDKVSIASSWKEAYEQADMFITCTVSSEAYIDMPPKKNALLLNVSLRDFKPEIMNHTQAIVVDDWDEVCRHNTDIERMHIMRGLQRENVTSFADIVCRDGMEAFIEGQAIMFNPMGLAIFDIAIAAAYYRRAIEENVGTLLEGNLDN